MESLLKNGISGKSYWFDQDAVRVPNLEASKKRAMRGTSPKHKYLINNPYPNGLKHSSMIKKREFLGYENMEEKIANGKTYLNSLGSNKRCVWSLESTFSEVFNKLPLYIRDLINQELLSDKTTTWKMPTSCNKASHFATFPLSLVEPMILSGCPKYICKVCGMPREKTDGKEWTDCGCGGGFRSGIVCDIFLGIGTTIKKAHELGRNHIGLEISEAYYKLSKQYTSSTRYKKITDF